MLKPKYEDDDMKTLKSKRRGFIPLSPVQTNDAFTGCLFPHVKAVLLKVWGRPHWWAADMTDGTTALLFIFFSF